MPQPACIRHTDLPGTSRLFADFSYHFDRVAQFYGHNPHETESFRRAAGQIVYPDERRAALVQALRGHGDSENLNRLAQPGTVAVITGQQVGLFSGPAYTIYKALTAVQVAQRLTDQGTPAVPVFWLATEDHDFAEVDHVWLFGTNSQPQSLKATTENGRQRPVGPMTIAQPPVKELHELLAGMPFADEVVAAVSEAYPAGVSMGEGCHRLLKTLLGKYGLLFLDPLDPAIRVIGAPLMTKALREAAELRSRLTTRNRELTEAGYHAQVHVDAKTSLFFLLENGERKTLRMKDAEYANLADRAADVSPNALLRPVWQDYLLPTVAYVGGPGELAYLAQSHVLYDQLLGRMPVATARTGFTVLDPRSEKLLAKFKLTVAQVMTPETKLTEQIALSLVPRTLQKKIAATSARVATQLDLMKASLLEFDPTLAAALDKSGNKIVYQLEKMQKKTEREVLRRDARAAEGAAHLAAMIYPHKHPQERFYSILPFLAQYGLDFVDQIARAMEYECPDHRVYSATNAG